jgi:hypothetical protein
MAARRRKQTRGRSFSAGDQLGICNKSTFLNMASIKKRHLTQLFYAIGRRQSRHRIGARFAFSHGDGRHYAGSYNWIVANGHDSLAAAAHTGGKPIDANCVADIRVPGQRRRYPLADHLAAATPQQRRSNEKRSTRRIVFDVLFNGALLASALILTFIVLVREEQFAFGQQQMTTQMMQQRLQQATGEGQIMLPSE